MNAGPKSLFLAEDNVALATDLYELTMAAGYLRAGMTGTACFELFVRDLPPCRSYLIVAGLEQAVHYLKRVRFSGRAIDYLRSQPVFAKADAEFFEYLRGFRFRGDLVSLTRRVRRILDRAGLRKTRILGSGDLNEYKIAELIRKGARIDAFGVGTDLVTSRDLPALPGVYKLVEAEADGKAVPRLKLSTEKESYPGRKQIWRVADARGRYHHDLAGLADEAAEGEPLLLPVLRGGRLLAPLPTLAAARERSARSLALLPSRCRRLDAAPRYPVRWSRALRALRTALVRRMESRESGQKHQEKAITDSTDKTPKRQNGMSG